MIDPSIALSYKPAQIESPLDAYGQAMNLQNMAQSVKLRDQQIQEGQIKLNTSKALNQAIAENTTANPDGTITVNHDAVAKQMQKAGFGAAGLDYADQQKKTDLVLKNLNGAQALQAYDIHDKLIGGLSAVRAAGPEGSPARQAAWQEQTKAAYQSGLAPAGTLAQQVPDDATLATWEIQSKEGLQRISARIAQQRADTAETHAKTMENFSAARLETAMNAGKNKDDGEWKYLGISSGRAKLYNTKTHEIADGGPIDESDASGGGGKGKQVTPDAALTEQRANQTDYEKNAQAEITAKQQVDQLSSALKNGKTYVYANGRVVPFSSMKQSNNDPLTADDIQAYQDEMRQRMTNSQKSVETAVANKNNALQRNHVTPQVSTDKALAGYRQGWGTQPAAGMPPAATNNADANPKTASGLPVGNGRQLDPKNPQDQAIAQKFLAAAGGDKAKARKLAQKSNWKF